MLTNFIGTEVSYGSSSIDRLMDSLPENLWEEKITGSNDKKPATAYQNVPVYRVRINQRVTFSSKTRNRDELRNVTESYLKEYGSLDVEQASYKEAVKP